jgi:hypothetical protein
MTIYSGTAQQYKGKTVDFLLYDGAKPKSEVQVIQELVLPGQSGALITGPLKLAQRFMLELLTERGSMIYNLNRGTFFMTQIRAGLVSTPADLFQLFASSELELRNTLKLEDASSMPADERYVSADLLDVTLVGDTASLQIRIDSAAGTSREIIFPLRIPAV